MELTQVILVDVNDRQIGIMEKMKAHQQGSLHRAFSVFIFNKKGEMLLQQRALNKYHSGGLWTNACCSHPLPGEETIAAAKRRLQEELGFEIPVEKVFDFVYKADFDNGLTEHEFDHVYVGEFEGKIDFMLTSPFGVQAAHKVKPATQRLVFATIVGVVLCKMLFNLILTT